MTKIVCGHVALFRVCISRAMLQIGCVESVCFECKVRIDFCSVVRIIKYEFSVFIDFSLELM